MTPVMMMFERQRIHQPEVAILLANTAQRRAASVRQDRALHHAVNAAKLQR